MMKLEIVASLLVVGCSGSAPRRAGPAPAVEPNPAPAERSGWSVSWERSLGWLSSPPLFGDGEVMSGGVRFRIDGGYVAMSPAQVPGGRLIATVRARLDGGQVLATSSGGEGGDRLIATRLDRAPEDATARSAPIDVEAIAVAGARVAVHTGKALVMLALPGLAEVERIELGPAAGPAAVALHHGGVAFTRGGALVVRSSAGAETTVARDVEAIGFAPAGDVAAVVGGGRIRVVAIPGGGEIASAAIAGGAVNAVAAAPGGRSVAVVRCPEVAILDRAGASLEPGFRASFRGDEICPYLSGLAFDGAGDRLAIAAHDLTVMTRGAATARRPAPAYRPALPDGFVARDFNPEPLAIPIGSGLATAPRQLAAFEYTGSGGWAGVSAAVRDASQLAHVRELAAWGEAVLVRFESTLRDERDPNRFADPGRDVLPYHRAFIDERGRRNLEYAIYLRDGCEPHDRYVRFVEDGADLVQVTMTTVVGLDPALARPWLAAFIDAPFGGTQRILAQKMLGQRGC